MNHKRVSCKIQAWKHMSHTHAIWCTCACMHMHMCAWVCAYACVCAKSSSRSSVKKWYALISLELIWETEISVPILLSAFTAIRPESFLVFFCLQTQFIFVGWYRAPAVVKHVSFWRAHESNHRCLNLLLWALSICYFLMSEDPWCSMTGGQT